MVKLSVFRSRATSHTGRSSAAKGVRRRAGHFQRCKHKHPVRTGLYSTLTSQQLQIACVLPRLRGPMSSSRLRAASPEVSAAGSATQLSRDCGGGVPSGTSATSSACGCGCGSGSGSGSGPVSSDRGDRWRGGVPSSTSVFHPPVTRFAARSRFLALVKRSPKPSFRIRHSIISMGVPERRFSA